MTGSFQWRVAAFSGALAVGLGAFGAHGLASILAENDTAEIWKTASSYHLIHTVVLLILAGRAGVARGAWWALVGGMTVFSGTLYVLAVTGIKWLGAITPIGGTALIVGWVWLALAGREVVRGRE